MTGVHDDEWDYELEQARIDELRERARQNKMICRCYGAEEPCPLHDGSLDEEEEE